MNIYYDIKYLIWHISDNCLFHNFLGHSCICFLTLEQKMHFASPEFQIAIVSIWEKFSKLLQFTLDTQIYSDRPQDSK